MLQKERPKTQGGAAVKYVIVEVGYEYNDEYYETAGGDQLVAVYDDKGRAEDDMDKLEKKARKGMDSYDLQAYCGPDCMGDECEHRNLRFYKIAEVLER
jgi:hypothetical protein